MSQEDRAELMLAVMEAQSRAAWDMRNVSTLFLVNCAAQRVPFHQAVIGALSTLGGKHGPVAAARRVLYDEPGAELAERLARGEKIDGFGNSIYQDCVDPNWSQVDGIVEKSFVTERERIRAIARLFEETKGKKLYPNAACFTAIAAHISGVPRGAEDSMFLMSCIPIWAKLYNQHHPDYKAD